MTEYIVRRILHSTITLWVVSMVVFGLVHFTPGDPARVIAGDMATGAEVEMIRQQLGLDRPLLIQYTTWLLSLLRGDLGRSLYLDLPVAQAVASRAEPTVLLMLMSLLLAILIGVPAGLVAALKRNSLLDQLLAVVALIGVSIPTFWFGLILILLFSVGLGWFPSGGYVNISDGGLWNSISRLIMPAITVGFTESALISRISRTALLDTVNQDYVRTARSKGLPQSLVVGKHALRNALVPILTVIGLSVAIMLGGLAITETVFTLPGVGRLVVSSIGRRDYPVIQGVVLLIAAMYVVVNLLIDLVYTLVDPRIRY